MIRTLLVDDEVRGLSALRTLIQEYCPELKIVAECTDAGTARQAMESLEPQLVFLDISLPDQSAFELLRDMDRIPFEIIFVTAHHEYSIEAFHFSAVDYLVKPVDEDLLIEATRRATRRISMSEVNHHLSSLVNSLVKQNASDRQKLCIPSVKGFQVVDLQDILYAEASGGYTNFVFRDKHIICSSRPIHEYEDVLADSMFVRVHKSFLVNLLHVREYIRGEGGTVILSNGMEVEVSRRKKELFLEKMRQFYRS